MSSLFLATTSCLRNLLYVTWLITGAGKEMHCLSSCETERGTRRRNLARTRSNPQMLHWRESGNWRSMAWTPRVCVTANGIVGHSGFILSSMLCKHPFHMESIQPTCLLCNVCKTCGVCYMLLQSLMLRILCLWSCSELKTFLWVGKQSFCDCFFSL